jgi:phosphoglycolate phosphatase
MIVERKSNIEREEHTVVYKVKYWLQSLSFRTGVIVLLCCIPFYILSFAQMLLPISVAAKGILWTVLFGLAKTCQYGGLSILGVEGYKRLKDKFKRNK